MKDLSLHQNPHGKLIPAQENKSMYGNKMKKLLLIFVLLASYTLASEKPNIILIMVDDLGIGDVEYNGQTKIKTPNITKIAQQGVIFTNFYAGAPVCGPSRASLLYGQHTGHAPIRGNPRWTATGDKPVMDKDALVFPEDLKKAGYSTAVYGKWAMNEVFTNQETGDGSGHPFHQGFDEFVGFNTHREAHYHWPDYIWDGYQKVMLSQTPGENWKKKLVYGDDLFTEKTLDFIERKAKEPFFIYLNYTAPHKGYSAPAEAREPYESLGWPKKKGRVAHYRDDKDIHTAYAGMITRFDTGIGQILDKLAEEGIAENTLVLFTNDNGHELSSKFFKSGGKHRGMKRSLTDGGIRVPTVAIWPNVIKAGSKIDTNLAFWDIMPTLCEIAGVKPAGETDGISFLPALKGDMDTQEEHEYLYWEFNERAGPMQALRFGEYKALRLWNKKQKNFGAIQLFHIVSDPAEKKNLAAQYPELMQKAEHYFNTTRTEHAMWPLTPRSQSPK